MLHSNFNFQGQFNSEDSKEIAKEILKQEENIECKKTNRIVLIIIGVLIGISIIIGSIAGIVKGTNGSGDVSYHGDVRVCCTNCSHKCDVWGSWADDNGNLYLGNDLRYAQSTTLTNDYYCSRCGHHGEVTISQSTLDIINIT